MGGTLRTMQIIEMELKNYRMSNLNILSRHIATKATKEEI